MWQLHCNGCLQPFGEFVKSSGKDLTEGLKWFCPTCRRKRDAFEEWCYRKREQFEEQLDAVIEAKREEIFRGGN